MDLDLQLAAKQEEAVQYMLRPESDGAALLAFDVGLGKTRTGLMFTREYDAHVVLACVPLQTIDGWISTAAVEFPDIPVYVINSSKSGVEAMAKFHWRQHGLYLITHQYFEQKAWTKKLKKKRRADEPDSYEKVDSGCWSGDGFALIYDESHRSANPESWTHKALLNINPQVFKLSMSGTFMGDRFGGAYGATRWLWPHRTDIIHASVYKWRDVWAELKDDWFSPGKKKIIGEKNPGSFVSALPCYIREESERPDPIVHDLWIELYPEQRRVYEELDAKMVAWINDEPMTAEYSITKRIRQRQTTLAMPTLHFKVNEETGVEELDKVSFEEDAESAKIDRLITEINGQGTLDKLLVGEQLLILTDSQKFARILTARLNDWYGDVAREWSGKITKPKRKLAKAGFIDGSVRFLVGVQAAMGTGTDGLQHASHIVVMMSLADRRIDNEQGIGRLNRTGQPEPFVHVVNMLALETVDTGQASAQMQEAQRMQKIQRTKIRRARMAAEAAAIRQRMEELEAGKWA